MSQKAKKKKPHTSNKPGISNQVREWYQPYLPAGFCFLFAFLLYSNTLRFPYVRDDPSVLKENRFVKQGLYGIPSILKTSYRKGVGIEGDNIYRPLSQVMFAVEWTISPGNASLSHFMNVLFYAFSCFLLFMVLRKYFAQVADPFLLLTVLIFAAHPIHTEVVANIKSRDEVMSLFFLLITLLFFHQWLKKGQIVGIAAAALCFFLSLMSKEGSITMLAVFPVAGWYFSGAKPQRLITGSALLIIPAVCYILIRHQVLSSVAPIYTISEWDNYLTMAPDWGIRFATAVMILGKYLLLLVFPHPLVCDYSYNQMPLVGLTNPWFLTSLLVYTFILWIIFRQFLKKDPMIFGLIFFMISISIYSNLFMLIGTSFGERLMFLPSVGFSIAFVLMIARLSNKADRDAGGTWLKQIQKNIRPIAVTGIILVLFSAKTMIRSSDWKDSYTLNTTDILRSPNSTRMQNHVGNSYRDLARNEPNPARRDSLTRLSLSCYQRALAIMPSNADAQEQAGLAWYLLGNPDMAMFYFQLALNKNSLRPDIWNNVGSIYVDRGDFSKAMGAFKKATELNPFFADSWQNMGSVLGRMGKYQEAIPCFLKAIESDPEKAISYQLLGLTYQNLGQSEEAKHWFDLAVSKSP